MSKSVEDLRSDRSHSDEELNNQPRPSLAGHRFTSERQLGQKALQNSSQAYDKQLLSKIGGPSTPTRTTAPPLSTSSTQDPIADPHTSIHKHGNQLKPLTVPAISPGYNGFRSPIFDPAEPSRPRYGSISTPGPLDDACSTHRGSYDHTIFSDPEFGMEENGMRDLNINERSPAESEDYQLGLKGGLKRRASSPPSEAARDDRPIPTGHNDLYHRRSQQMLVNRNCTASRFQSTQNSLSSAGSASQRSGSIGSSFGFSTAPSSMASYCGDQRLSPSALSPLGETELGAVSPYAANRSLDPSPRGSLSRPPHQRGFSEAEHPQIRKMSTESMLHSRQNSIASRIPGAYICECCPKKPKKFDSEDELR